LDGHHVLPPAVVNDFLSRQVVLALKKQGGEKRGSNSDTGQGAKIFPPRLEAGQLKKKTRPSGDLAPEKGVRKTKIRMGGEKEGGVHTRDVEQAAVN